jgi:hypothetical protein
MKNYTFDVTLHASFTIEAESEDEARRILAIASDCATVILYAEDMEDEFHGEASFADSDVTLALTDGEEA